MKPMKLSIFLVIFFVFNACTHPTKTQNQTILKIKNESKHQTIKIDGQTFNLIDYCELELTTGIHHIELNKSECDFYLENTNYWIVFNNGIEYINELNKKEMFLTCEVQ